jgi:tRNA-specific 2-thiouridylase
VARDGAPLPGHAVLARLRNTAPAMPALIESVADGGVVIRLQEPQFGIAAGQAAAIYDADDSQNLLGGGWITAAPLAALAS